MMKKALLVGAATLALAGFGHAAIKPVQPVQPVQPALAPAAPASAVAEASVAAFVHAQANATRQLGGPPRGEAPPGGGSRCFSTGKGEPFYVSLPGAVRCMLVAEALGDDPQDRTAAPLPGALWLFGSALLVFLGISARRTF